MRKILFIMLIGLAGCMAYEPTTPPKTISGQMNLDQLPGWQNEDFPSALAALRYSCRKASSDAWVRICRNLPASSDAQTAQEFFTKNFIARPVSDSGKDTGLITGYYEAELRGSLRRTERYRHPIYRMPDDADLDLTRADIDRGALRGKNLELLWADDPVSIFTMQVQGSGRVILDNGDVVRLGFAGKNRHPYFSIGKTFGAENLLASHSINMDSIEQWLRDNPGQAPRVMQTNPSYIFFRRIDGLANDDEGPIGAWGVPLLPGRSIAVDRSIYPLGIPFWLDVAHPDPQRNPLQKMVFAHDTGSAIKGVIRADYFFGAGVDAKYFAGQMRGRGRLYTILPR